jgi:hypothetical protein
MKKLLFLSLILISFCSDAQHKSHKKADTLTTLKPLDIDLDKLKREIDSTNQITDSLMKASTKRMMDEDVKRMTQNNEANLNAFVAMQKERERKQWQSIWIRLAIGGTFLIILIVRFVMRRKNKKASAYPEDKSKL